MSMYLHTVVSMQPIGLQFSKHLTRNSSLYKASTNSFERSAVVLKKIIKFISHRDPVSRVLVGDERIINTELTSCRTAH